MRYSLEQQNVFTHKQGVGLVHAGPGTGKSATLIGKITRLLKQGVNADAILMLTFSASAKQDFASRLQQQLGGTAHAVSVLTIHAFGRALIRRYYKQLGFTSRPKTIRMRRRRKAALSPAQLKQHTTRKLKRNVIDYEDMLSLPLQLFNEHPKLLTAVARRYQYLLVDELQDINEQQATLITLLAKQVPAVLLMGDQKQAIYGFIDADIAQWNYIVAELKPKQYTLSHSYRIPKATLPFVNAFAADFCTDLPLISAVKGYRPLLQRFADSDAQANFIANEVTKLLKKGVSPNEIACLARVKIPLQQLTLALDARGIKTIESHYSDTITAWSSILRKLVYITKWMVNDQHAPIPVKSIARLLSLVKIPLREQDALYERIIVEGVSALKMKKRSCKSEAHYKRLLSIRKSIIIAAQQADAEAGIQYLIDALLPYVKNKHPHYWTQIQRDFSRLKLLARDCHWQDVKTKSLQSLVNETGITLTTVHSAKGKEWKYVFLLNVVDGEFPLSYSKSLKQQQEEERLFYTAITRHSVKLYLLETVVNRSSFNRNSKMNHHSYCTQSDFITPHLQYLNRR